LLAPFELGKIKPSSSTENHAAYNRARQDILDSKFTIGSGTYYTTQWIEEEEGGGFVDYGKRITSSTFHYQVPIGNAEVNNYLKNDAVYYDWVEDSNEQPRYYKADIILVLPAQSVIRHPVGSIQFFLNAPQTHCIFQPLRDYCL
jgi:hypothetical protein